jgi:phosphate:Na+ symporter
MSGFNMIVSLLGGLGLFLYGMKIMGEGLENTSGEKLKSIFEKITSNPIKGVLTGAFVTAIIQSSSATTVMVVGFVNARLMNLFQAAAVIMGANIGTTITAQLITLKLDKLAPIFIAIGAVMVLFAKGKRSKQIGNIVLGFGILFFGMDVMKDAMKPLRSSEMFTSFVTTLDGNVVLGIFTGLIMTAIVQSSSATTGILIALASTGSITLGAAVPVLFGCNIGTCVTALLSSIGTSKTAKKAAVIHLIFNVVGTIVFIPLITPLINLVHILPWTNADSIARQVADVHTIFNITNTVVMVPFIKCLVLLVNKIIPQEDEYEDYGTKYIDDRLLETPVIAVGQTKNEIIRMGNKAKENLQLAMKAFYDNDNKMVEKVYEKEKLINLLEDEVTRFLVKLSKTELSAEQTDIVTSMFHVVNDIERIGDHAENIADLTSEKIQKNLKFSDVALNELQDIFNYTFNAVELSIEGFKSKDVTKADKVMTLEERIDSLEKELRASHIKRLNSGICNATVGANFLDIISNLERIGDHSTNIAQYTINK